MYTTCLKKRLSIFLCEPDSSPIPQPAEYLITKGFSVHCIAECRESVDRIITHVPDLVLLDADLPEDGGYEVCRKIRPYYSGPVVLQGRNHDEASQLLAFELGADDYVIRPVSPALLTARINAILKRSHGLDGNSRRRQIQIGELFLDAARREVFLADQPINLTTIQFELLWYLAKRSGRIVSREELYEALYQKEYNGIDRSVDVCISRVRKQLGDHMEKSGYLKTIRGSGYLFVGNTG